jgi:hypothetical protein
MFAPQLTEGDPQLLRLEQKKHRARNRYNNATMTFQSAKKKSECDLEFMSLLRSKENHNVHGDANILKGLGSSKISVLIRHNILTAKGLLQCSNEQYPAICHLLCGWKKLAREYYDGLIAQAEFWKSEMEDAQSLLEEAEVAYSDRKQELESQSESQRQRQRTAANVINPYARRRGLPLNGGTADDASNTPVPFSKFDDKKGYNGRVLIKYGIDAVVASVFHHCKKFMESKMQGLLAEMLKIDFQYKTAGKIRVWTQQGSSFPPY